MNFPGNGHTIKKHEQDQILFELGICRMKKSTGNKVGSVRDGILREIASGNYVRGAALPPERELAELFGVSYMTLRKAVGSLVEEGVLERVARAGTFVRSEAPEETVRKLVGVVVSEEAASEELDFIMCMAEAARRANRLVRFAYTTSWEDRAIIDLWRNSDALVCESRLRFGEMSPELREKFLHGGKPVILTGSSSRFDGFDSVFTSPDDGVAQLCAAVHAQGHRRIAVMNEFTPSDEGGREWRSHESVLEAVIAEFRSGYPDVTLDADSFLLAIPCFESPLRSVREHILDSAGNFPHTLLICPLHFYWGVIAGLTDAGLHIPEDVSVLCVGDWQEAEFYQPRPATLSLPLREHAHQVMELIRLREEDPLAPSRRCTFPARFTAGETLAAARRNA